MTADRCERRTDARYYLTACRHRAQQIRRDRMLTGGIDAWRNAGG